MPCTCNDLIFIFCLLLVSVAIVTLLLLLLVPLWRFDDDDIGDDDDDNIGDDDDDDNNDNVGTLCIDGNPLTNITQCILANNDSDESDAAVSFSSSFGLLCLVVNDDNEDAIDDRICAIVAPCEKPKIAQISCSLLLLSFLCSP